MKRSRLAAFAGLVIAVVLLVVAMVSGQQAPTAPGESPGTAVSTTSAPPAAGRGPENPSGLPAVNASQLPKEARQTLVLIAKGGPYPYREDDGNFGNFEGLLPKKGSGFYKEYTVPTPGKSNRGERRIVVGRDAAKYYTADHYESFKFIVEDK